MSRVIRAKTLEKIAGARDEMARARDEALRIIENANADAARIRREAHAEGIAAAHLEAARLLLEASRARDAALLSAEHEARKLALGAAAHIIGEAIALEPDRIAAIVRGALMRARQMHSCEVYVHPDDLAALEQNTPADSVRFVADRTITRGGCVVRSPLGTVDARVEVRIDAIAQWLAGEAP